MPLNRRFGPLMLLILSINGMIGSAWLFAPMYAAKIAGTGALVAWLIAGSVTALIALTFVELSLLIPVAGGTARIPQVSHGLITSFTLSWVAWLSALTMTPIEVQAVLQYASIYFDGLISTVSGTPLLTKEGFCWAIVLMLVFCLINSGNFKNLERFNFWIFIFKIFVIMMTIGVLFQRSFHPANFSSFQENLTLSGWQAILSAVATGGIAFAFTGFKHGVELAGEAKSLPVSIPLAVVGSVVCCLVLYVGLQIAFIGALSPEHMLSGWQSLTFTGDVGPFAGLIAGLGIIWLLKLLYMDAMISPSGAGLIYVTSTARLLFAMSQMGYVPKFLSYLNKHEFPIAAIFLNFFIGIFLFLPLPGWQAMVGFLVSGMVLSYAIGPIALLSLRLGWPEKKRVFRLPAATFVCGIAFYFCNLLSYWTGWETIWKLMLAILIGFIVLSVALLQKKLAQERMGLRSLIWLIPYLGGLSMISYLGAFGGKNLIPFGWDFLAIAFFSLIILYMAVKNRLVDLKVPMD